MLISCKVFITAAIKRLFHSSGVLAGGSRHTCQMLFAICCLLVGIVGSTTPKKDVFIFHMINNKEWGELDGSALQGNFTCSFSSVVNNCEMISSDTDKDFFNYLVGKYRERKAAFDHHYLGREKDYITMSLYHIHTWNKLHRLPYGPNLTALSTDLTMAESEESSSRFSYLFNKAFPHYDGYSTTHPNSSVPRTYFSRWNLSTFVEPKPFDKLIKGAAVVISTCHRGDGNNKRLSIVKEMMKYMRIDSLGKCLHTKNIPEGIALTYGKTYKETYQLKQLALNNYMFYLAFENNNEPGYVTEKVFDGLIAGTLPVYLGATEDCLKLIPSDNSVIFVSDYGNNVKNLTDYLLFLQNNEIAYENHRLSWRKSFNPSKSGSELLTKSWPCRLCEWAVMKMEEKRKHGK
jgi:hypothetical protein